MTGGQVPPQSKRQQLFGTDGIRGVANRDPITSEMSLRLGRAITYVLEDAHAGAGGTGTLRRKGKHRRRILIGKDTRLSGYMIETALASGICSMGADVLLVGPLPTPGVAFLTRSMRADAGVVISASHNPYEDNGIKFFSWDGFKLPDALERRMEEIITSGESDTVRPIANEVGKAFRISDAVGRTIVFLKNSFPRDLSLEGLKVVVDCANGAAYRVAPDALSELGADVIPLAVNPDGRNINSNCGALYPESAQRAVREHSADVGICLDGDADRALLVDETGEVVDGDEILAICARAMNESGTLRSRSVVATVMSNMGLDLALSSMGLELVRTPVGDRYVVEEMLRGGHNLGGEQSGHVVFLDQNSTGDGCLTALQVLALMVREDRRLSQLRTVMHRLPQVLLNVAVREKPSLSQIPTVQAATKAAEKRLAGRGRVLVRYSGTESLARVMVEGESEDEIKEMAAGIAEAIQDRLRPA